VAEPGSKVAEQVASRARGLTLYVNRVERLHDQGALPLVDLHRTYAGAYLSFYVFVERSLERLFVGVLMNRYHFQQPDVRRLVDIRSDAVARAVVSGDRSYADWLPFDLTRKRAKAFLSGGRPFATLPNSDKKVFLRMGLIRNAIAHDSRHALKLFQDEFVTGKSLPPEQHRPPGYLRGEHAVGQTRLEYSFAEASAVMKQLCR
jgi:hypothetical protein